MTSATLPRRHALNYQDAAHAIDTRPVAILPYRRISEDDEGRALGVARQEADLREWIEREYPDARVLGDYCDNDLTASTNSDKPRPKYDRLLRDAREAAESGLYQRVIIAAYTSGRLTRRPTEFEGQIQFARRYGVVYHFLRSPAFDLNTSAGRRMARIMHAQDAGEPEDISERVLAAKKQAAENGEHLGGPPGFGFRLEYDHNASGRPIMPGRLVVVEEEAVRIRKAVADFLAGVKLAAIAAEWSAAGVPAPAGGGRWLTISVKSTLRRARMAGLSERNGVIVGRGRWGRPVDERDPDGPSCCIITEDELWAVRAKLGENAQRYGQGGYERRWLGPSIYRCGQPGCDSTMRSTGGAHYGEPGRYRCQESGHNQISDAPAVDAYVRGEVCMYLATHGAGLLRGDQTGERDKLIREATAIRGKIEALALAFASDAGADAQAAQTLRLATRPLEDRLKAIAKAQATLIVPDAALASVADAEDPVRAFLDAPLDRQRAVVDALVTVTVKPGKRGQQPKGTTILGRVVVEAATPLDG